MSRFDRHTHLLSSSQLMAAILIVCSTLRIYICFELLAFAAAQVRIARLMKQIVRSLTRHNLKLHLFQPIYICFVRLNGMYHRAGSLLNRLMNGDTQRKYGRRRAKCTAHPHLRTTTFMRILELIFCVHGLYLYWLFTAQCHLLGADIQNNRAMARLGVAEIHVFKNRCMHHRCRTESPEHLIAALETSQQ